MSHWERLEKVSYEVLELAGGAGGKPWLLQNLTGTADALVFKKRIEDERPTKAKLRAELNKVYHAAKVVERSLKRPQRSTLRPDYTLSILELVHLVSPHLMSELGGLLLFINQYADALEKAAEHISASAGASRVQPPPRNLLDSMGWCALIICEVWMICRGKYPSEKDARAQQAADLLWNVVVGSPTNLTVERWSRHLKRAKKCNDWQAVHIRETLSLRPIDFSSVHTESA